MRSARKPFGSRAIMKKMIVLYSLPAYEIYYIGIM